MFQYQPRFISNYSHICSSIKIISTILNFFLKINLHMPLNFDNLKTFRLLNIDKNFSIKDDLLSGITVALALVPEAVAFAFVAGISFTKNGTRKTYGNPSKSSFFIANNF
jgi:hypothetical protein